MTFFRDLSQFRYVDRPELQSAVNIGWLSPFWYCPIGRTTPEFRDKLFELCAEPQVRHCGCGCASSASVSVVAAATPLARRSRNSSSHLQGPHLAPIRLCVNWRRAEWRRGRDHESAT